MHCRMIFCQRYWYRPVDLHRLADNPMGMVFRMVAVLAAVQRTQNQLFQLKKKSNYKTQND